MLDQARKFFHAPTFPDNEEKTSSAYILHTILWAAIVALTIYTLIGSIAGTSDLRDVMIAVVTVVLILGLLWGVRRGYVQPVAVLFGVLVIIMGTLTIYNAGTAYSDNIAYYFVALTVVGLMVNARTAIILALLEGVILFVLLKADHAGMLPPVDEQPSLGPMWTFIMVSIVLITIQYLSQHGLLEALNRVRRNERELAQRTAELAESNANLEQEIIQRQQAQEESTRLQEEIIEAQQHALKELSTPIIPMMDNVIVMPLIGSIDSLRARDITRTLLAGINQHRAKVVILDVTGVGIMDTGIVNHLNKTIQAARLKGAQTIVTGVSDAVAEAIVDLGIDWSGVTTLADLQTGLLVALGSLGFKLNKGDR